MPLLTEGLPKLARQRCPFPFPLLFVWKAKLEESRFFCEAIRSEERRLDSSFGLEECAAPDVVKARKRSAIISILLARQPRELGGEAKRPRFLFFLFFSLFCFGFCVLLFFLFFFSLFLFFFGFFFFLWFPFLFPVFLLFRESPGVPHLVVWSGLGRTEALVVVDGKWGSTP